MIASRQIAFGKAAAKYSAVDYIQDGLVAMWDGIENAGLGAHDGSATVWKDLSDNGHDIAIPSVNDMYFGENFLHRGSAGILNTGVPIVSAGMTVEMLIDVSTENDASVNGRFFGAVHGDPRFEIDCFSAKPSSAPRLFYRPSSSTGHITIFLSWGRSDYAGLWSIGYTVDKDGVLTLYDAISGYATAIPHAVKLSDYGAERILTLGSWGQEFGRIIGNIHRSTVYSRVLTAEEIAYNYNIDKVRFGL